MDKKKVEFLADLMKIELTDEEREQMAGDLGAIINWADVINGLDTKDVPPTIHIIPINNVFRDDTVQPSMDRKELLAGAPNQEQGCFSVPKIVE